MENLKLKLNDLVKTPSDINEHLYYLKDLANSVKHVTEFGVRFGCSSLAFLNADVILRSYDVLYQDVANSYFEEAKKLGKNVSYEIKNTLKICIEPTDLLFIDTFHSHDQVLQELRLHAKNVNKYIVFHDTVLFGRQSQPHDTSIFTTISNELYEGKTKYLGILDGIEQYIKEDSSWKIKDIRLNNNGLTTIERF
jgi:cephalosporin hydroxylase